MKKLLLFAFLLPFFAYSQTVVTLSTADTSKIVRTTGTTNAELILRNQQRAVPGVAYNRGNGWFGFSLGTANQILSTNSGATGITWITPTFGTVTSVATNTGTGITGGTITSTGTLALDTAGVIVTKTFAGRYQPLFPGLQDSLTKKANRTFDNVASGAIANVKLANSTISGVSLGSNLNTLTISSPLTGTSYNGSAGVSIGIPAANTSTNGYLTSTDWNTFNGKGASYTASALTKTDDTNVTLTLGGTPATALLQATSITAGWTGTLSVARGGTGSGTKNFVDLTTTQTIAGDKTLSNILRSTATTFFRFGVNSATTAYAGVMENLSNQTLIGIEGSSGAGNFTGGLPYSSEFGSLTNQPVHIGVNGSVVTTWTGTTMVHNGNFSATGISIRNVGSGTVSTDSILVKKSSDNLIYKIPGNSYLTSSTGVSSLAGTANQITASASTGAVTLSVPADFRLPNNGTSAANLREINTGNTSYFGIESSVGGSLFGTASAYATVVGTSSNRSLQFFTNDALRQTIDGSGNITFSGNILTPTITTPTLMATTTAGSFAGGGTIINSSNTSGTSTGIFLKAATTGTGTGLVYTQKTNSSAPGSGGTADLKFQTLNNALVDVGGFTSAGVFNATGGISSSTTAVTQSANDNSTKIATTAYVDALKSTSGTYTPTLTNSSNVTSSTAYVFKYHRIGNQVFVQGTVDITPTTTVSGILDISLPIASDFTGLRDALGQGVSAGPNILYPYVTANTTLDTASLNFTGAIASGQAIFFSFAYTVQ